jgi:inosine-uridine nucleoside N-ribohydrolase
MAVPVWMDVDTGIDDAVAVMLAHALQEIEILGISAVCGNTSLKNSFRNTRAMNRLCNSAYPVYAGAEKPLFRKPVHAAYVHGENGLGDVEVKLPEGETVRTEKAWDALYECAKKHEGELRLIATAPLTNIAIAFAKYPDLPGMLNTILIMGGATTEGNTTPCAEFNIYADPEAAQAVLLCGAKIVLCPLDVTEKVYLPEEALKELKDFGNEAGRFVHDSLQKPWAFHKKKGHPGIQMHDSCPVLYLVHPELFKAEEAGVYVETKGSVTAGKTVTDLYSDKQFEKKNALVVLDADSKECIRLIKEAVKSLP